MDIGKALSDSFEYAREAVWGKWVKWILLIISMIIFPLILGYLMEIYRGKKPAPELANWCKLFIDGIKLFIVGLIYAIPVILVILISYVLFVAQGPPRLVAGTPSAFMSSAGSVLAGLVLMVIVLIIVVLPAGVIRFARTDKMGEAFNFSAILAQIGRIGWGSYIFSLIVILVVVGIITFILQMIPVVGMILRVIIYPAVLILMGRFLTLLYDSAAPAPAPAPA
jgi:hypothetical protein